ncbi:TetR/AcrR family transcriptional regulator [bacterium]|nr:TetR/AcrR family transcriptional regulator [bacterium]
MAGKNNTLKPKERILEVAVKLFAEKGYADTGVREIARKAGVNLAMISYYFGSKLGILKEIISEFSEKSLEILNALKESALSPEDKIRQGIAAIIDLIHHDEKMATIVFKEVPYRVPEIARFKSKRLSQIREVVEPALKRLFKGEDVDSLRYEIIGPVLISMIYSHFLFKPVLSDDFPGKAGELFYQSYAREIAELFLYGVIGKIKK